VAEPPDEEPLSAVRDRLDRAQEHLDAIKPELIAYYKADPCTLTGKFNPDDQTGEWGGASAPFPPRLNTLIGEFLHDARSALNHLARQLVLHNGGTPTDGSRFPVWARAPVAKKEGKEPLPNVVGGLSVAARTVIHEAQPYQWGDNYSSHPLWVLDKLWNIDKHRDVVARLIYITAAFRDDTPAFSYSTRLIGADEYEAKLALVPDDPEMDVDAQMSVQIGIVEPEFGIKLQLLGALEQILKTVLGVFNAAEDRCF
jgi:hypothetical protein